MLTEMSLRNFRCFENHTILLQPQTIMVGANNAGKSTVIEAMRLLSLVVTRFGTVAFKKFPNWIDSPVGNSGMSPSLQGIEFNTLSIFYNLGDPPAEIAAKFDTGASVTIYLGPDGAIFAIIVDENGRKIYRKSQALEMDLPSVSVLPQVSPIAKEEVILSSGYARKVTSSQWASLHFRNQLLLYEEYFEEFKELSESTWPGLRIISLDREGNLPGDRIALLVQDNDFTAEVSWMGHGLQVWLQTMWFLARYRDSNTIILDEPDVYMHADLQRKLIRLLSDRHNQIVIATHSVEIMSEVDARNILVVNRQARRSIFATSIPAVQQVVDSIGGIHNLQLARLWHSRRCLLVEGKDVTFLRIIHDKVYPSSQDSLDTIPNMSIGGWGGWNYAVGSHLLLRNAVDEEVITYCIFDSDYHTQEQIVERYNDAQKREVELHVLTKKEIENYFIVPTAIYRIIEREDRNDVSPPTVDEIEQAIDEMTLAMENEVFDAMSTEYFYQDKSGGPTSANRRARQRLDKVWNTREGRYSSVSGKKLISKISCWSQSKYGVSLNPERILREMQRGELDNELVRIIRAIHDTKPFMVLGLGVDLHMSDEIS